MALLLAEHFDGYTDTTGYRNAVENITDACSYSAAGGRWGGGAVQNASLSTGDVRILKAVPGSNMIRVAFHIKCDRLSQTPNNRDIIRLFDSGSTRFWRLIGVDGSPADCAPFLVSKFDDVNPPATLVTGRKTAWNDGSWHHIEIALVAHTSTGSFKLKIDGVEQTELTIASGDTSDAVSGNVTSFDRIMFCGASANTGGAVSLFMDDLIVWDDTGTEFTGELTAEHRLRKVDPTADGAGGVQWTPFSGANYTNVDESAYNSDTDYVSDTVAGHIDYYNNSAIGWTPVTVIGVIVESIAKLDTGSHSWRNKLKSSSTISSGTTKAASSTYRKSQDFYTFNPDAAGIWTKTTIEAAQFGVEFVS